MASMFDPLSINVQRQWEMTVSHIRETPSPEPRTQEEILHVLMHLLYDPRYTLLIAEKFRPILILLCAQWLDHNGEEDAKFAALALLVNPHEELFPILSAFLRKSSFSGGSFDASAPISISQLHLRLLAHYRILVACPHIPAMLNWSPEFFSHLIALPHPNAGVCWLAVRCYALHLHMTEVERDDLQSRILGPAGKIDVPIEAGKTPDGETKFLDGWLLPALEEIRIQESRKAILEDHGFYGQTSERIEIERFTRRVVNVHGVLLLRDPLSGSANTKLVTTSSSVYPLRELAVRTSLRLPTLLSSPPSSGKTLLLTHLASLLHPAKPNQVLTLHLSDTSLDARSLLGSYVSSVRRPGTFEWQEGMVVRAMKHGLWLVLEDIDRASSDVLGVLIPLIESLAVNKHIGSVATLDVPGHGTVHAMESFMIFGTRSITLVGTEKFPSPTFLGCSKFSYVDIPAPTDEDLATIINSRCPKLGMRGVRALIGAWNAARALPPTVGARNIGTHELELWCKRVESLLPFAADPDVDMDLEEETSSLWRIYPHVSLREDMFLEARDIFFGAGALTESARAHNSGVCHTFAEQFGLSLERSEWVLEQRIPELQLDKDGNGLISALRIGKTRLPALRTNFDLLASSQRPFVMHRPALLLTERIATSLSFSEPVLLVGETGTGKTTLISHIASLLNRKLVSLNLSHQTESSDLVGGFKPVDTRIPGGELQRRFTELFSHTFSRKKNVKFEAAVRRAQNEGKWKRIVDLWKESTRLALDKIRERSQASSLFAQEDSDRRDAPGFDGDIPRKRRKIESAIPSVQESEWLAFERDVRTFDVQHVQNKGKFAFGYVEGPLVEALKNGHWVLLDEINLASSETLECISNILRSTNGSVVLTEQGSFSPVPRHPDFRLFACMNPATDVGKKDLPLNIRSRFTEIHVAPPDSDRETLVAVIQQYIGHCALADKGAILDVAEFYTTVKKLAEQRELADGSNHRPHFSMRTLTRALTFASDTATMFGLRRALWEGCLMAFSMALDEKSTLRVKTVAQEHLLATVKNVSAMMGQIPHLPENVQGDSFERIGPFWLERGNLKPDPVSEYILTPSVQSKLVDLARVVLTRRFPVLIEGPTSSGKTSAVEYLARRTGHRFVRVNNHEHTDIQEYLGTYVSDVETGRLVFRDGILVRALRNGDWIVLDELNLAPTDVLEALNRLLDDNRELVIPETQEIVKPHAHFMLFATQNPPGLYAGRKVLSRAFRSRFLEVHFEDVPQSELQTILSERCRIPDSYAQRIVNVFQELSKRRQTGRVFETKHGFATLRDLFRWASREATSTRQLAENGYMLLAERARRADDKAIVKEVIETVMKEHIDVDALYNFQHSEVSTRLGIPAPSSPGVIWTAAMKRLFVLVASALRYNEPVLLVGQTGSGKTSVCQLFAETTTKQLITLNCHQSTETADLIGGQRPVRNRHPTQTYLLEEARQVLRGDIALDAEQASDVEGVISLLKKGLTMSTVSSTLKTTMRELKKSLQHTTALFEWHDGPLIRAMRSGNVFLLDEISLADDSVLERLNSVLEPARNIVLAERGGLDVEYAQVTADLDFKLLATMNPGGDYGKKELSPSLRNRFTEIWVPQVTKELDLQMIVDSSWRHDALRHYTTNVLNFTSWLSFAVGEPSFVSLRDLLTWVDFSNEVCGATHHVSLDVIFHHAAHLVFLDGLECSPHTSSWSTQSLNELRERGRNRLEEIVPLGKHRSQVFDGSFQQTSKTIYFGAFGICQGPYESFTGDFNLRAPTTLDNIRRLVRACQVSKPILLEGSPGVGKTSLVSALGEVSGHRLCRINLSDQTDLMDLFGSDLPVEGGRAGEFSWKDAAFLRAMQDGDWVLLDEMNLAPQAVLEGLNAVLDHRGTVFIPELGRSFTKHPSFRIFAAQNPLHQGGGRKGLPKSFLDRFTKVYVKALSPDDFLLICQTLFPALPTHHLQSMILFNTRLCEETMVRRSFGSEGSPWEFNLRDVIRWATLLSSPSPLYVTSHPFIYLDTVYLQRFRTERDRIRVIELFCEVFSLQQMPVLSPWVSTTSQYLQYGSTLLTRGKYTTISNSIELQRHLRPLASATECIHRGWLTIILGPAGAGKTHLVRYLAAAAGSRLREFSMSSGTDTSDLLGSFEQATDIAARFEWRDGPLVQAMKDGHWLVMENANLCSPSVLDRLNSLCETNGVLVLTERGQVQGQVVTLKPHREFRLILTLDPRSGELSRAMRNRGVEIYLPVGSISLQDRLRIQNAIRTPLWSGSAPHPQVDNLAIHFELLRRGDIQVPRSNDTKTLGTVRGALLCHDSGSSAVLDQAVFQRLEFSKDSHVNAHSHALCSFRLMPSPQSPVYRRMLSSLRRATEAKICTPDVLLERLQNTSILELRRTVEQLISKARGVPLGFMLNQPFDLLMNPNLLGEEDHDSLRGQQLLLSKTLELLVHVHFSDHRAESDPLVEPSIYHQSRSSFANPRAAVTLAPSVSAIFPLYSSIMEVAHDVLKTVDAHDWEEQLALIDNMKHLVDIAEHLRNYSSGTRFDFSAVRVISDWSCKTLAMSSTLRQSPIHIHAEAMANEVSLTSGHGMQEIWGGIAVPQLHQNIITMVIRLDQLGVNLDPRAPSFHKLRADTLNVVALLAMNTAPSKSELDPVLALCNDVEQRLVAHGVDRSEVVPTFSHQLAIAELDFLSAVLGGDHRAGLREGNFLVQLTSQKAHASIARVALVKHYLWASETAGDHPVKWLAILASLFQRWMCALNGTVVSDHTQESTRGPGNLLKPIILHDTLRACRHERTLEGLDSHENSLRLEGQLALIHSAGNLGDRMLQITTVWKGVLMLIAKCFKESQSLEARQAISHCDPSQTCGDLVELLSRSAHSHLSCIIRDRLLPASRKLDAARDEFDKISSSGAAWIAMGFMLLELYVPNIPLDPVAVQSCILEFWRRREADVLGHIEIHTAVEKMITGNDDNIIISTLRSTWDRVHAKTQSSVDHSISRDLDINSLHTLHGELSQFLSHVITPARFDAIMRDLEAAQEDAEGRVSMVQNTITGFTSRVEFAYPQFSDIIQPISMALSQLVFGLHLLLQGSRYRTASPQFVEQFRTLVHFPTVAIIDAVSGNVLDTASSSTQLLLGITATAYEVPLRGYLSPTRLGDLDKLNGQLVELWLEDRDDEEKELQMSQSLYRSKERAHDDDFEEREFRDMFPTFELEGAADHKEARPILSQTVTPSKRRVSDADLERAYRVHLWVFDPTNPLGLREEFHELRNRWVCDALDAHCSWFSQHVDRESLPYRVSLLSNAMQELKGCRPMKRGIYSFYHDSNISETRRAISIVRSIWGRLHGLLEEWPGQMVLHHIKARCEAVLKLDLQSPIAKILTALEQLLLQTEDWEIYANRENTLKPQQAMLSALIVEWRRLELSCWSQLLNAQSLAFSAGTSEWWFHLYELAIRGTLVSIAEGTSSLDAYFIRMIPLVEQFISTGPLGQYSARVLLLKSFSQYAETLSVIKTAFESEALARAGRILRSLHGFYDQFRDAVSCYLVEKRGALEKDLSDFIKLASWKDVNVQGLRQSAQRTHRHLHKCIRKFRELLREPIATLLSHKLCETESHSLDQLDSELIPVEVLPPVAFPTILPSRDVPNFLLDLPETYSKFKNFLSCHGHPMINAVLFRHIEDFAEQIADTVATLSRDTMAAGNNARLHKTLIMRKRKAWIDLLKELKRAGMSSRLKPEVLAQQQNKVWLMDRLTLTLPTDVSNSLIVSKGEEYFNRMLILMPELRRSLASHHEDLPTRELERAATYVESSYSLALSARTRLVNDYLLYQDANRIAQRLRHLNATRGTIRVACDIVPWLELCCKLEDALQETTHGCVEFSTLGGASPLSPSVVEAMSMHLHLIRGSRQSLSAVHDAVRLTPKGLMTSEEFYQFDEARATVLSTETALRRWISQEPRIRHLCVPLLVWLQNNLSSIKDWTTDEPSHGTTLNGNHIERLLVIVQGILACKISSQPPNAEPPHHYASESEKISRSISSVLALDAVSKSLSSFVEELTLSSSATRREKIQTVLPFVDAYLGLIHNYLSVQAKFSKAFLKLSYILCKVVHSLSTQGFCKPSDMEDGSEGHGKDGAEVQDGTGLGQGTGSENISTQIEDESQVEGLRGEETGQERPGDDAMKEDAIEMGNDFDGDPEDLHNDEPQEDSVRVDSPDVEEQVGRADPSDPGALDEKLWGDNNIEKKAAEAQTSSDGAKDPANDSEIAAREDHEKGSKKGQDDLDETVEENQHGDNNIHEDHPIDAGKGTDDYIPEADTLDLPDDLDFTAEEDGKDESLDIEVDPIDEDGLEQSTHGSDDGESTPGEVETFTPAPGNENEATQEEDETIQPSGLEENAKDEQNPEPVAPRPDFLPGDDETRDHASHDLPASFAEPVTSTREDSQGKAERAAAGAGDEAMENVLSGDNQTTVTKASQGNKDEGQINPTPIDIIHPNEEPPSDLPNPLRSLGDTLKELQRRFDQIGDSIKPKPLPSPRAEDAARIEYLQEGMEEEHNLQALGPAEEHQVAKLRELQINDSQPAPGPPGEIDFRASDVAPEEVNPPAVTHVDAQSLAASKLADVEDVIADREHKSDRSDRLSYNNIHSETPLTEVNMEDSKNAHSIEHSVELAVKEWQETGHSDSRAAEMWRLYDSLTQELSYSLCEQLRLILEPTLATRLRGDYRTGKRLNMKKIIPYIASEYTKDKIWLRRTRPSQREYQVLIALDDSRSMAESRSVHLAYETLALVSKALNRLESGEIAIARFGESVEIVHGFEEGMLGDREGEKVMRRFRFEQRKTDVFGLVETSLKFLTQARERRSIGRSSSEAAELWQLEIIISDGICQDHDKLRTALRKAEELRIMIVFIIVDSLHTHHASSSSDTVQAPKASQNTILHMNQVSYKEVGGGRMELQMERYLDSFPFQYYVVLRNVDALPDVLSGTLKQFFERISEE